MTATADEGAPATPEAGGPPGPSVPSGKPEDQLPSTPSGEQPDTLALLRQLQAEVASLREDLPGVVDRLVQGTKDRRFRVLQDIDPDMLAAFKGYLDHFHGDFERAVREMQIDRVLQQGAPSGPPQGSGGAGEAYASRDELGEISGRILSEAGIAFGDPGYVALVQEHQGRRFTAKQWEDLVLAFAFKRVRQSTAPAGSLVPESGPPAAPADLRREYQKELGALRASRNYRGLIELRKKYRALGLDV